MAELLRRIAASLLLLTALGVLAPRPALAEAPSREGLFDEQIAAIDGWFGDYVVGPLATVLFFDVAFWDNTLPLGNGVGTVVGEEEITGYGPAGYVYQRRLVVTDPVPVLERPREIRMGQLRVEVVQSWQTRADGARIPVLVGQVPAQPVDLHALGIEPADEGTPDAEALVPVSGLAPFGVRVDRRIGMTVPQDVMVPPERVELAPGDLVVLGPDETARVVERTEEGFVVRALAERVDPSPLPNPEDAQVPVVVLWLVLGATFFTLRMQLVNLWGFGHAIAVTMGRYDNPDDEGEISHFQALSSALSATVGLGNIAGVAIAITVGGPGAVFWMMVAGFLGMASKFTECTLGQMYRIRKPDGSVSGGPMYYLDKGLRELGFPRPLGKLLAGTFAVLCVGGSLGGGNMFQANQSFAALAQVAPWMADKSWLYGLLLAFLVGLVIIGGIKRIGAVAGVLVPFMCLLYVGAGLIIVVMHADQLPTAIGQIIGQAFTPEAGFGGMLGVLAQGFKRAAFSSEAGIGSASIAHSAASTPYPVREGIVALLEPFIDTIVVCATTALVVVITGAYTQQGAEGVVITQMAFGSVFPWFPTILSIAVVLFAFSTMISWSYYGETAITWLLGDRARVPYRVVYLMAAWLGAVISLGNVVTFSDLMILGMAFPNVLGALLLSGKVKAALDEYWGKLKRGEFERPRVAA